MLKIIDSDGVVIMNNNFDGNDDTESGLKVQNTNGLEVASNNFNNQFNGMLVFANHNSYYSEIIQNLQPALFIGCRQYGGL
jgi:hypothetical protein